MSNSPRKVLVTGVAGFIGSNLIVRLLDAGHVVFGIDDLSKGRMENISEHSENSAFQFLKRDITVDGAFDDIDKDVDCIVHLAAYKIPRYGNAISTLKINYIGSEKVLELGRRLNCKCVLASTSDVYGRNPDVPFSEEHTDHVIGSSKSPRWSYAVSKLFDEHLALAYQESYGFPVTLLRYFGSYGPKMHLSWWGGPPPVFIDAVLNDKVIPIHGDGMQTRSFTYATDTVEGTYQAIMREEANGDIFNIGATHEMTIVDLAKTIKKVSNTPGELKLEFVPYESFTNKKYEDVMRRVPDTAHSEKVLGVKAQVSIEEGMAKTIEWQRSVTENKY